MTDFVWVVSREKSSFFGSKGIFSNYIIPANDLQFNSVSLVGHKLWVVLRGADYRLLKLIKVKKIERINDGLNKGDFLISPIISESFKLCTDYSEASKYKINEIGGFNLGVSELNHKVVESIHAIIKNNINSKFGDPRDNVFDSIDLKIIASNDAELVRNAIKKITENFTLEQVWSNVKLGPFSNFTHAFINCKTNVIRNSEFVLLLNKLDPVNLIFATGKQENDLPKRPRVDTEFTLIDPEKIYSRKLICIDKHSYDLECAINKTEHAEHIHQEMLKDISRFLISKGITCYESGSIDLLYQIDEKIKIFELKSANDENLISQSSKGLFQLACYLNELNACYADVMGCLIIHRTVDSDLEKYVVEVFSRFKINVLFYDPDKEWPDRVKGLPL